MMHKTIVEALALVAFTALIGTGFHVLRPDAQAKIPFVGNHPNALKIIREPRSDSPLSEPKQRSSVARVEVPAAVDPVEVPAAVDPVDVPAAVDPVEVPEGVEPVADPERIVETSVDEAFAEFDAGGAVFVDARRTKHFEAGRIPGAVLLPLWEGDFEDRLQTFLNLADPGAAVFLYCSGGAACEDSHTVGLRLRAAGFENLRVIREGYPGWEEKGFPVERGPEEH